jgi:hypothetical protein
VTKANKQNLLAGFAAHKKCCSVSSYAESKCKVALPANDGTWLCLSGTTYQQKHGFQDKLCDLLFAWEQSREDLVSSPLELKGGHVDVSHVQQQNGADIIDGLLKGAEAAFLPVLVIRSMPTVEQRMLPKYRINFRGKQFKIFLLNSGGTVTGLKW